MFLQRDDVDVQTILVSFHAVWHADSFFLIFSNAVSITELILIKTVLRFHLESADLVLNTVLPQKENPALYYSQLNVEMCAPDVFLSSYLIKT